MDYCRIAENVILGKNVLIHAFVNLYGCTVGNDTRIGAFVEIQKGVSVGEKCKISSHTFICEGVSIGNRVFVGHNVTFINDLFPRSVNDENHLQTEDDWHVIETFVHDDASIGSSVTILCGVTIGAGALVGAGSVVLTDIPPWEVWAGNPAKKIRTLHK